MLNSSHIKPTSIKPLPLRAVGSGNGHNSQARPPQAAVNQRPVPRVQECWISVYFDIPDTYVESHLAWSFEKICATYRDKLFKTYRKAGVRFAAITVSSILSPANRPSTVVNPQYGLRLHSAGVVYTQADLTKLKSILRTQCHQTHEQSGSNPSAKGFRPNGAQMRHPRWGSAIYVTQYKEEWRSVIHLIQRFDRNVLDYLRYAAARNINASQAGTSIVHGTFHMRRRARNLYRRKLYVLWQREFSARKIDVGQQKLRTNLLQEIPVGDAINATASERHDFSSMN